MSIADALRVHHPSSDSFVQKWGEVRYEDTPEAIHALMHKSTDAAQFYDDIPVEYLDVVKDAEAHTA
jgi:hypothetical protein